MNIELCSRGATELLHAQSLGTTGAGCGESRPGLRRSGSTASVGSRPLQTQVRFPLRVSTTPSSAVRTGKSAA